MSRNRFAALTTTRLDLSDGDWVEVKDGLTYREQQEIAGAMMKYVKASDQELGIDWAKHRMLRLLYWLTDWSLKGADGKTTKLSKLTIESLDPDTAAEIEVALDKHIEARDAQKKDRTMANGTG